MNIIPRIQKEINANEYVNAKDYESRITFVNDETLSEEEYKIIIANDSIEVTSATERGRIWACVTLKQLASEGKLPVCQIHDKPRFSHRGIHIDCARHFHSADELKKIIDEVSKVKINTFHWHLSDDQGFRVDIEKYPELTRQKGNGEYYTKAQIKDLVDYAAKRGVEVIPEIDMPGHTRAMTAAYPHLSCTGEKVEVAKCGGIYPVILCPGKETTFEFVEDVIDEMVPLFPGRYFHIGGDEAPKHRWKDCPDCRRRMEAEGLKDETALQGYFNKRVADYIKDKYGKQIIMWNDAMEFADFVDSEDTIQYWSLEHKKQLPDFVNRGGRFIFSDMFDLYYDYVAAMSPMVRSYTTSPVIAGVDYSDSEAVKGMECCIWSEYIDTDDKLEDRIFPRVYAMAENAWSEGNNDTYADFNQRLKSYRKHTAIHWGSGDPKGLKKQTEKLSYMKNMATGMDKDVREMTVEAAAVSEEFMAEFKKKMM